MAVESSDALQGRSPADLQVAFLVGTANTNGSQKWQVHNTFIGYEECVDVPAWCR